MKKSILILFALILNLFLADAEYLKCGDQQIDNCKECGKDEEMDTCAKCEAQHFPLLENLLCFPCDDPTFGQIGCLGECDSTDYTTSGFAYCEKCKEGFYNLEGFCYQCEIGSPGCIKCTYEKEIEQESKRFKCQQCLNEQEYRLNDAFRCEKCNEFLENCNKCHFFGEQALCDECNSGYYVNSDDTCSSCYTQTITGGYCHICSLDLKPDYCWCHGGYVLEGNTCRKCQDSYCAECELNKETDTTRCLRCYDGYTLNSANQCVPCEEGCRYCYLDQNTNPECFYCYSNKFLPNEDKCLICPPGCSECEYDNNKKESVCITCDTNYVLDPETKECRYCESISDTGEGCRTCEYNPLNKKYECKSCHSSSHYYSSGYYYYYTNYVYIINKFQCLSNTNPEKIGLYGCLIAEYQQDSDKYKCLECKNTTYTGFIPVITDQSCIDRFLVGLSDKCLEAEKIGDSFSCTKCDINYTLVQDSLTNIKQCYEREDTLSYCLEGKLDNGNLICTKCLNNSELNENNICSCNSDSFSKDIKRCYKCNDIYKGNSGCDEPKGCDYFSANDQLNCKNCKEGYFEYTEGQCFLCSNEISGCNKCHYDKTDKKLICDSCLDNIYILNKEENKCELNECEEYPEISPGCVICKDKLNEYKDNSKCQRCKYGYFKTKEGKCIYCRSEEYGGPGCDECGYEKNENGIETNNIICKGCYPNNLLFYNNYNSYYHYYRYYYYYYDTYYYDYDYYFRNDYYYSYDSFYSKNKSYNTTILSSKGKCYDCKILFSEACVQCDFIKNSEGKENLKCTACSLGFYLTPEGNCVNFTGLITEIEKCNYKRLWIGDIELEIDTYSYSYYFYSSFYGKNLTYYNNEISKIISAGNGQLDSICDYCYSGYFIDNNGKCEQLDYDKCSFNSIIKNYNHLHYACRDFCDYNNNNVMIRLKLKINSEKEFMDFSLDNSNNYDYINYFNNYGESKIIKSCLNNSGEGGEYAPENLKYCKEAYYYPNNNTYECIRCLYDYSLNNNTHICNKTIQINNNPPSSYENKESDWNDWDDWHSSYFTLVTNENAEKEYIYTEGDLLGCVEANANTTYVNSKYDCTKCSLMYVPFYSKFFERNICQNIKEKIIKESVISYDLYNYTNDKIIATNGQCERDYLFTPDGVNCYKCNDELVGMPGCKGSCSFSLKRNRALKCESECKLGYIESSEGVCSSCSVINKGCHECHYENEYPSDYTGIRRQRRFVCDYCEGGYFQSPLGRCLDCADLGLENCNKCELDPNKNDSYICSQCSDDYFLNEEGNCEKCDNYHFKGININKCINCGNTLEGGIDKCLFCESDGEKAVCKLCLPGYILLTNNNSCLEIVKNKELHTFSNCEKLIMENNKLSCLKCKKEYSLIKKDNINECTYIPTLYDTNFERNYENHFYNIKKEEMTYDDFILFRDNDYIYNRYKGYYPCQEAINLGLEKNPLYSCTKCYEYLGNYNRQSVIVKEENSNVSFCIDPNYHKELKNCLEATYKIKNGKEVYNCTECNKNNVLTINRYTNSYYCASTNATTKCIVLYCKTCNPNDGYICEECLPDYEINELTGSCVKKTEVIPAITWKDIYRLNMNGVKLINNRYIHGPSLMMRGITSSQINTRHAFLIYLTFKIKHRIRNLEEDEEIKMPAICEILEGVEETSNDVNMVDYECIGNQTNDMDLTNYKLDNIEEGNNENSLKKSNLNELIAEIKEELGDLEKLENKLEPSFTFEDLMKIVIFEMNEKIKNIKAKKYKFNFKIEGKLNKDITQKEITIKREFELSEIDNKADCTFTIGLNKTADLSCNLNVEKHKDIKTFSFKTSQINTDNNEIYLSKFNDIVLINSEKGDNKKVIIIVSVICGVVGAALIGVGIFFLVRKLKSSKETIPNEIIETKNPTNKNIIQSNHVEDNEPNTEQRTVKFENNKN